jgi:hypothetical protein
MAVDLEVILESGKRALPERLGGRRQRTACYYERELITADTCEKYACGRRLQTTCSLAEQTVANLISVNVICLFKAIEVNAQNGERLAAFGRFVERRRKMLDAVGQIGQ